MNMENNKEYPINIKLIRGAKNKYRWEITIRGDMVSSVKEAVDRANQLMKATYGDVSE